MYAHAAPVVEFTNGASPVTYAAQEASFQHPQEIVYEQPALMYEANGSQPVEYAHLPAPLTCAAPAVTHATRLTPMIERVQKTVEVCRRSSTLTRLWMHCCGVTQRVEDVSVGTQTVFRKRKAFHGDRVC